MDWPCCNFCKRSFPNRRALGGHMRIHVHRNSAKQPMRRYGFRENRRKTWKLMENEIDTLCSNFGEKDMKFHSETEVTAIARSGSLDSSIAYENEQKVGAFCLMLLSRGACSVTDSSDKASVVTDDEVENHKSNAEMNDLAIAMIPKFDLGINAHEKIQSLPSESNAPSFRKDLHYVDLGIEKKRSYSCKTCSRTFSTYQALGGHRASHKKFKVVSFSEIVATKKLKIQNHGSKSYDCSICGRIFGSGQALGGHKRSHLVGNTEQRSSVFGTFDLNLPAMEDGNYDEMIEDSI